MLDFGRILLPLDLEEPSLPAVYQAAALSRHFHSEILILHVIRPLSYLGIHELGHGGLLAESIKRAEARLDHYVAAELTGIAIKRLLLNGDPARLIIQTAHDQNVRLIVMGPHGFGAVERLFVGSVTAKVLHDAECPVWTAVHSEQQPPHIPAKPRRIACAVDLGTQSGDVLRWATKLSQEFGAPLTIIHATAFDPQIEGYYLGPGWRDEVIREAMAKVTKFLEGEGVNGETHIEPGSVPEAVIECAREQQADVLVIGRSAHSGVTGRLPTNAYAIIRSAPCPVLGV